MAYARLSQQRLQRLARLRPLALAIALLALVTALVLALSWRPAARPRSFAASAGTNLPDTLLVLTTPGNPGAPNAPDPTLGVFDPAANAIRPLLSGAWRIPFLAPDGRQTFAFQREIAGDRTRYALTALSTDRLAPQWRANLDATSADAVLWLSGAVTADRVYVASHPGDSTAPIAIVALDRADGQERTRWSIDLAGRPARALRLVAAPDGTALTLLFDAATGSQSAELASVRLALPDGHEIARQAPADRGQAASGFIWEGRPTTDGRALYLVSYGNAGAGPPAVSFFDLTTGAIEQLPLGFAPPGPNEFFPFEQAIGHDGARLYILAPATGELALVNLTTRVVEQTMVVDLRAPTSRATPPLARAWGAVRGLFLQEASAKFYFQGSMQLSPDGRRLYAVGMAGQSYNARPTGIWVIDTTTWRVTDRWATGTEPFQLLLSSDGRALYSQESPWGGATAGTLRALDTTSGAELFVTEALPGATVYGLAQQYRETYGTSPAGGVPLARSTAIVPIASLIPTANPATLIAGDSLTVEARFADPISGKTVARGQRDVRFEPPTRVTATLTLPGNPASPLSVPLTSAEYGVYRATATPPAAGSWSLRVDAEWGDGATRRVERPSAVGVQAAFVGSDGERYLLRVTTTPAVPTARQPVPLTVAFVNARTGAALPASATLVDGLPARLEASLFAQAGVTTVQLAATGHGIYRGEVTLWAAERWQVQVIIPGAGTPDRTFEAGAFDAR